MDNLENLDIRKILPHRYPMLLVDRIVEIADDRIVGIKCITANEPYFQGHFPDFPVMPGVLIIEAMAQTAGVLALKKREGMDNKLVFFASIEEAKFRRPVLPGDTMRMEIEILRQKPSAVKARGVTKVNGQVVAEATILCSIIDRSSTGLPGTM